MAEKLESNSQRPFLHIWIMNFKEMTDELLGRQRLPTTWAVSQVLGCEPNWEVRDVCCPSQRSGEKTGTFRESIEFLVMGRLANF